MVRKMWEIFIPVNDNRGMMFPNAMHRKWDTVVESIAGGLTIYKNAIGLWINYNTGEELREPIIPVRIACSEEQIEKIAEMTRIFYDQVEVLAYEVSANVKSFRKKEQL